MELRAHYNQHGELARVSVDGALPEIQVSYRFVRMLSPDVAIFERTQ